TTPVGFIPLQDKGYCLVNVQLPDSASLDRTNQVLRDIDKIALKVPGVDHTISVSGQSVLLSANGSNFGTVFVTFKEFEKRVSHETSGDEIIKNLRKDFREQIADAIISVFPPPPVDGLG